MKLLAALAVPLLAGSVVDAATVGDLRDLRRVVLVAAPSAADAKLRRQRAVLAGWSRGAAERDISVVEIGGGAVKGADDSASSLAVRYGLPAGFAVILIGKDGHVALRSATVVTAAKLEATIDAMPMRRAGER